MNDTTPVEIVRQREASEHEVSQRHGQEERAKAHLRKSTTAKQIERRLVDIGKRVAARNYPAPFTVVTVGYNHLHRYEVDVRPHWWTAHPIKQARQEVEVLYKEVVGIPIVQLEGVRFQTADRSRWSHYNSNEPLLFIDETGVLHECPRLTIGTRGFVYSLCPLVFDERTLRKWSEEKLLNLLELLRSIIQELEG